ncbi:conserved hypothetical protein [Ricinus communis]|uniref:Uncharacterized protein n=1 Tax=Ricinus communis TaxID=3988 RepID=B9T0G6_RICCO|nr:conserved hypothetical protein [Ricinus communis]
MVFTVIPAPISIDSETKWYSRSGTQAGFDINQFGSSHPNKETGDDLAQDIRRCEKSNCEKRKNHQKMTIVRGGFHRKTPRFWQTNHNYRRGTTMKKKEEKGASFLEIVPLLLPWPSSSGPLILFFLIHEPLSTKPGP